MTAWDDSAIGWDGEPIGAASTTGSLRGTIASVISSTVVPLLGVGWEWRPLTSAPTASVPTHGAWTMVSAVHADEQNYPTRDDTTGRLLMVTRATLRVADTVAIPPGAHVRSPDGTIYDVVGVASRGAGSIRYQLEREVMIRGDANRGGRL